MSERPNILALEYSIGAVHKVRHAREGSEKVWQFVTEGDEVQEHVTSNFKTIFIHMKPKIESDV